MGARFEVDWHCLGCKRNFTSYEMYRDTVLSGQEDSSKMNLNKMPDLYRASAMVAVEVAVAALGVTVTDSEKRGAYGLCAACFAKADPLVRKLTR